MARDQAEKRVFVTSHRLGAATRAGFIVPAIAAVREKSIEVRAYYGMQGGTVTAATSARLAIAGIKDGVQIRPEYEPNLHAKILAWDDDNVLITSQNWLSADPSESNMRREIGIFIRFRGTAKHLIENFENSRHK
jgi:phosphatidylserine/phosphatidylglycerophosphate/cardiolipin synthase-like enzyme